MDTEKDQMPAVNSGGTQPEGLDVKTAIRPDEHTAYIAAVAESEPVVEPAEVAEKTAQTEAQRSPEAEATTVAQHPTSEPIKQDPEQTSSLEENTTVVEPIPAIAPSIGVAKPSRIVGLTGAFKKSSRKKKIVILAIALMLIGLLVFGTTRVFSGGKVAGLVSDSKNKIAFLRPENWQQSKEEDGLTYYTENGVAEADVSRGMVLGVQKLGIRYSSLTDDNKANIRKSFQDEFSSSESFSNDQCSEVGNVQTEELVREGYDLAFKVDADCTKLKNGNTGGTIKMFVGWSDVDLHVVGVVADTPTWNAEGKELDTILSSIKPE